MKKKTTILVLVSLGIICLNLIGTAVGENESTSLQITEIKGGIGGITAIIENTGENTAENFAISLYVEGGMLGNIAITQICTGCSDCGTTIPAGETKAESTTEAGFIFGFGPVDILVTASANNADLVSESTTGFVIGPLVLV